jgi:hypothetical protein
LNVHFYRYHVDDGAFERVPLQPPFDLRCWRPGFDGLPPKGSRTLANYCWWVLAKTGGFARGGFAELRVEHDGRLLHRLIVTPRWHRFPFMQSGDLQIGEVWTAPAARRRNVAHSAIGEAHRRFAGEGARFWYVSEADNAASGALARSCGYRLVATGKRTRRFGLALLGQYVIECFVQSPETATHAIAPDCDDESAAGRSVSVSH